jgi:predicted nucleotidyltransferase component of viral defense system
VIDRSEILAVATDLSLAPEVVEKDYVLGWLLAGIYAHPELGPAWIFKGGTCLKKCYFETYRFSEDLDFTVTAEAQLDADGLARALGEVSAWIYERTGIEVPADQIRLDVYRNKRQGLSCEGRLYYNGPLRRVGSLPRIKLDLTADEVIVLPPVERPVNHPYSDIPEGGIIARCYSYEEVLAEKTRALAERTRPRDLYDVINLFRHGEFQPLAATVLDVLQRKCAFKAIPLPTFASLGGALGELTGDWDAMLRHQLPALPPFEAFWAELPQFFAWLENGAVVPVLAPAPLAAAEAVFRPGVGLLRRQGVQGSSALETIRFAAANRLCVDLDYMTQDGQRNVRRIEPYSLRQSRAGNILLYAVRSVDGQSRSYSLGGIRGVVATQQSFVPRFLIELTPGGMEPIAAAARSVGVAGYQTPLPRLGPRPATAVRRRVHARRTGPVYVYQCGACGKKFRHSTHNSHLNRHKAPGGWQCSGRTGYLVETKY